MTRCYSEPCEIIIQSPPKLQILRRSFFLNPDEEEEGTAGRDQDGGEESQSQGVQDAGQGGMVEGQGGGKVEGERSSKVKVEELAPATCNIANAMVSPKL